MWGLWQGGVGGHVAVEVSNIVDTPLSGHPLMTIWGWAFGGTSLMSMLRKPLRKLSRKLLRKPSRKMREQKGKGRAKKCGKKVYEKTVQKHRKTQHKIITFFSRIFRAPLTDFSRIFRSAIPHPWQPPNTQPCEYPLWSLSPTSFRHHILHLGPWGLVCSTTPPLCALACTSTSTCVHLIRLAGQDVNPWVSINCILGCLLVASFRLWRKHTKRFQNTFFFRLGFVGFLRSWYFCRNEK